MHSIHLPRHGQMVFTLIVLCLCSNIRAYPIRAGHCKSGPVIGDESGGIHGRDGMASLADGSISISFQSELSSSDAPILLNSTEGITIDANIPYTVNVARSDGFFRGMLMRLSGANGTSVETAWTATSGETQVLPSTGEKTGFDSACAPGVTALCHTSNNDKQQVTAGFILNAAVDTKLEVTIVINNDPSGSNFWHYSEFEIKVQDGGGSTPATISPRPSASAAPSPTNLETISPQPSVSILPLNSPSASPAPSPTNLETISPQPSASILPLNSPSSSPIPTVDTENIATSPSGDDINVACRWWCSKIPTEWKSTDSSYYPKCDWTFSCSECDECQEGLLRARRQKR